jgi:hypothetical protein
MSGVYRRTPNYTLGMSESTPGEPTPPPAPAAAGPSEDDLKRALAAFRKRLKLTILDQESKLGAGRPLTGGKKSGVTAIIPPNQFPREVWKELAARKLIKDTGGGFYTLP